MQQVSVFFSIDPFSQMRLFKQPCDIMLLRDSMLLPNVPIDPFATAIKSAHFIFVICFVAVTVWYMNALTALGVQIHPC